MRKGQAFLTLVCLTMALVMVALVAAPSLSFFLGDGGWEDLGENIGLGLEVGEILNSAFGVWGYIIGIILVIA